VSGLGGNKYIIPLGCQEGVLSGVGVQLLV